MSDCLSREYLLGQVIVTCPKLFRILIVDDDSEHLETMRNELRNPAVSIRTVASVQEARKALKFAPKPYHCLVVGLRLAGAEGGLSLMPKQTEFPYVVVCAAKAESALVCAAVRDGALGVFWKGPEEREKRIEYVYRVAALGYLMEGRLTSRQDGFVPLLEKELSSIREWAEHLRIAHRGVQRMCRESSRFPAKTTMDFVPTMAAVLCATNDTIAFEPGAGGARNRRLASRCMPRSVFRILRCIQREQRTQAGIACPPDA